jgi:hypothetical protein
MHDSALVSRAQRIRDLRPVLDGFARRQRTASEPLAKRRSFEQFRDDVGSRVFTTDIVQRRRLFLRGKPFAVLVALDRRAEFRSRLKSLLAREPDAPRTWRTVLEAPELRIEVTLTARVIDRADGVNGICWLLQGVG